MYIAILFVIAWIWIWNEARTAPYDPEEVTPDDQQCVDENTTTEDRL